MGMAVPNLCAICVSVYSTISCFLIKNEVFTVVFQKINNALHRYTDTQIISEKIKKNRTKGLYLYKNKVHAFTMIFSLCF